MSCAHCGDRSLPDDYAAAPEPASAPLTPEHFGIPLRPTFAPEDFAEYVGVSVRTIYREIEDGNLRALRIRGSLRIPLIELKHYFLRQAAEFLLEKN